MKEAFEANTPIQKKTGSCMQARLHSPRATNMEDKISEELIKNCNVCKFRATCPEQMLKKRKKVGHKCCAAANCNQARTNQIYHSMSFLQITREGKRGKSV